MLYIKFNIKKYVLFFISYFYYFIENRLSYVIYVNITSISLYYNNAKFKNYLFEV